ncbi:V(D)J recombination activating protein 2 isoform 2 [Hibiscus syriacus]|uniref:V(D)J recombination activating protein 2 isoform 2 n=1 Tax=Hibiscus syriacus TaxID=106335 RepID=A0A6A2XH97_HIBSY|nr:V(D)J recombination activating protein 2 isoform 2 [Hibiscus syriacus]
MQVMFLCNHCPFVKHLKKDLAKLSNFYMKVAKFPSTFWKGLAVVAISSNSVATHPQDGPQFMAEDAKLYNYPFPYLYDELNMFKPQTQDVARDLGAVCTPEFFLFKKVGNDKSCHEGFIVGNDGRRPFELVYHGQFDDSRPSNSVPVTGSLAIDSVLSGQPVPSVQKPSVGCSIKWHPQKS